MVKASTAGENFAVVRGARELPAVLLIGFNRPEPTAQAFAAIRRAQPSRLYVALDGPRKGNERDVVRCEAVRELIKVDWDCDFKILARTENQGLRIGVSSAIDWFFEHESEGIILEDDCVPNDSFWPFMTEMLKRYRDDVRIASVAGSNYELGQIHRESSYFFSRYVYVWGWATWARVWKSVDRELTSWPSLRESHWLRSLLGSASRERFWVRNFDCAHAKSVEIWSYYMLYATWTQGMMNVVPSQNLVSNIGFGPDAVHTIRTTRYDRMPTYELEFPLVHPKLQMVDEASDALAGELMFSRHGLPKRVWNRANSELEAVLRRIREQHRFSLH